MGYTSVDCHWYPTIVFRSEYIVSSIHGLVLRPSSRTRIFRPFVFNPWWYVLFVVWHPNVWLWTPNYPAYQRSSSSLTFSVNAHVYSLLVSFTFGYSFFCRLSVTFLGLGLWFLVPTRVLVLTEFRVIFLMISPVFHELQWLKLGVGWNYRYFSLFDGTLRLYRLVVLISVWVLAFCSSRNPNRPLRIYVNCFPKVVLDGLLCLSDPPKVVWKAPIV